MGQEDAACEADPLGHRFGGGTGRAADDEGGDKLYGGKHTHTHTLGIIHHVLSAFCPDTSLNLWSLVRSPVIYRLNGKSNRDVRALASSASFMKNTYVSHLFMETC